MSLSIACRTRDWTGNHEAGALASMIMNQQHTDQHLLSHQHDQVTHSFAGPAPSAATKAFMIYLLLFGHV